MPHLCPTNWPLAFLSFWLILLLLNTMIWWLQLPTFPSPEKLNSQASPTWYWK